MAVINLTNGDDIFISGFRFGTGDTINGLAGNDQFGPDTLNDTFNGGAGDDVIFGGAGNDRLNGDADNDRLVAGTGRETVDGGSGIDSLEFNGLPGAVTISLALATEQAFSGGSVIIIFANGFSTVENLNGTDFDDVLIGDAQDNDIRALAGNDTLYGGDGNDRLDGIGGDDLLLGEAGDDILVPRLGNDTVDGGAGFDLVSLDVLVTGQLFSLALSTAQVIAASVTVTLIFADGFSTVEGIEGYGGNDTLGGDSRANLLDGSFGDDQLFGAAGNDTLLGGAGNDILYGGTGNDSMVGGSGDDRYLVEDLGDVIVEQAAEGNDEAFIGIDGTTLAANVETGRLVGGATTLTGSAGGQVLVANTIASMITGGGGDDTLWGQNGPDTLLGGLGNDVLLGGQGDDDMRGGAGDDTYVVTQPGDVVVEAIGEGIDTVWVGVTGWFLADNVEIARLYNGAFFLSGTNNDDVIVADALVGATLYGADGNDTLWGQAGGDALLGNTGDDVLRGGGGNDQLVGGVGNDQLVGGSGADLFTFDATGWGADQVFDFSRAAGDQFDFRGSGLLFADLTITVIGANSRIGHAGATVDVYGVTGLVAGDFIFS